MLKEIGGISEAWDGELKKARLMGFQGVKAVVWEGEIDECGKVVVKTAWRNGVLDGVGVEEIRNNLAGYNFIPEKFRPNIYYCDGEFVDFFPESRDIIIPF